MAFEFIVSICSGWWNNYNKAIWVLFFFNGRLSNGYIWFKVYMTPLFMTIEDCLRTADKMTTGIYVFMLIQGTWFYCLEWTLSGIDLSTFQAFLIVLSSMYFGPGVWYKAWSYQVCAIPKAASLDHLVKSTWKEFQKFTNINVQNLAGKKISLSGYTSIDFRRWSWITGLGERSESITSR